MSESLLELTKQRIAMYLELPAGGGVEDGSYEKEREGSCSGCCVHACELTSVTQEIKPQAGQLERGRTEANNCGRKLANAAGNMEGREYGDRRVLLLYG